jgi:hypothetical protein
MKTRNQREREGVNVVYNAFGLDVRKRNKRCSDNSADVTGSRDARERNRLVLGDITGCPGSNYARERNSSRGRRGAHKAQSQNTVFCWADGFGYVPNIGRRSNARERKIAPINSDGARSSGGNNARQGDSYVCPYSTYSTTSSDAS